MSIFHIFTEAYNLKRTVDFNYQVNELRDFLQDKINLLKSDENQQSQEFKKFYTEQMEKLLEKRIETENDLREVSQLTNAILVDMQINEDPEYVTSGKYETNCTARKVFFYLGGFLFGFTLPFKSNELRAMFPASLPINILSGLIFGFLCIGIACKANITDAEEHNVPANHPRYIHDKQEMALWGISAVGLVGGIGRKTYKAAKDIGNVDGWKKMK